MPDATVDTPAFQGPSPDPFDQAASQGQPVEPAVQTPASDLPIGSFDSLMGDIKDAGLPPATAAQTLRKWRDKATQTIDQAEQDPEARGRMVDAIDSRVSDALKTQQGAALTSWTQNSFPDSHEQEAFAISYKQAGGDPEKMASQFRDRAHEFNAIGTADAFRPTHEQRMETGKIMSGDSVLARYATRDLPDGKTSVALHPDDPKFPVMRLSVPTPTQDDVKAAADKALQDAAEAKRKADYFAKLKADDAADPQSQGDWTNYDNTKNEAEANAAARKAKELSGPNGKQILTAQRIKEEAAKPQYGSGRVGQYALGQDFQRGLYNAVFQVGGLTGRAQDLIQGGDSNLKAVADAQDELNTAFPGSTRPAVTDSFVGSNAKAASEGFGTMFPYLASAGASKGVLAGLDAAGLRAAGSELAVQTANKTGIGAAGAGMGAGAAGGAEVQLQQRLDGLDQAKSDALDRKIAAQSKGDTAGVNAANQEMQAADAEAQRVKMGRDAYSVATGLVMGGFSKLSPLHNLQSSSPGFKAFLGDIAKQGIEVPGMMAADKLIVAPTTLGDSADVAGTLAELPSSVVQGAGLGFMMGGLTKIFERTKDRLFLVEQNQQRAAAIGAKSGASDPATLANLQTITDQQREGVKREGVAEAAQHIEDFKVARDDMVEHQRKIEEITSATEATQASQLDPSNFGNDSTPGQKQLQKIQEEEIRRQQLKIEMEHTVNDPALDDEAKRKAMEPLAKERKKVETSLVNLRVKLEGPHAAIHEDISAATGTPGEQSPQPTTEDQSNGQKEKQVAQDAQGQESGGRSPQGQDEVVVRPATAGAPGEPLPTSESSTSSAPQPPPQEPAPGQPPEPAGASAQSSQSSVDTGIREPWVKNALRLASQGKDQRGPLANALKAMTESERMEAARQAGVSKPTIDDHILLAREMSDAAGRKATPPAEPGRPQVAETPWGPGETTGIKNETIDNERAAMGMQPIASEAGSTWGELWDRASAKLAADPQAGYALVERLKEKGGRHSDEDAALLLRHKIEVEHASQLAAREINDPRTSDEERQAATDKRAAMQKALVDIHEVLRRSGSEVGRSLNSRKMMIDRNEVPTAAEMEADRRIAKGRDLTPEERDEVLRHHQEMQDAKDAMDADEESQSKAAAVHEMQATAEDLAKQAEPEAAPSPKAQEKAARRTARKKAADEAVQRLRDRGFFGRSPSILGLEEGDIKDLAVYGHYIISEGVDKLADFTTHMVEKFGKAVTEHIPAIFKAANSMAKDADVAIAKASKAAKKLAGSTPQEVMDTAHEAVKPGDPVDPKIARDLLEAHIRAGVKGVEDLTGKVKDSLAELYGRDISDRDVWDAITGYGTVSKPNPDAIKKQAAEYRSQMLLTRKLDAARAREAILKTGPQRERASEEVRRLQRELNEEMRKSGYNASSEGQVRGRLDAIKQALKNQIEDLESVIAGRQKLKPKGMPVTVDAETERLRAQVTELRNHLRNLPEFKAQLDAAENERAIAAAKASRDEYNRRIREKEFESKGKRTTAIMAELRRMRAERDFAAQNFRDAKAQSDSGKAAALQSKIDAATKAVEDREQAIRDNTPANKSPKKELSTDPQLRSLQERKIELDKELKTQRYGDGMDALRDWYENRKQSLLDALADREAAKPPGRIVPDDAEAKAMKAEIKSLEAALREKRAPEKALKSIKDRIDTLQKKIDEGDLSRKTKAAGPDTPEIRQALEDLDKLQEVYEQMQKADGTRDNEAYRKRLEAQMARMDTNAAAGFPESPKREPLKLDPQSEVLKAEFEKKKLAYATLKLQDELEKRAGWEKGFDAAAGINRAFKLSRVTTLAKLALYSLYHNVTVPFRELGGAAISKIMPRLAEKAGLEGGGSFASTAAFYRGFWGQGFRDAYEAAKPAVSLLTRGRFGDINARSPLKLLHETTEPHLPPRLWDIPQISHEVEKSPLLRGAYEMARQKLRENGAHGMTPTEVDRAAYEQAKRTILMSNNRFAGAINRGLKALEEPAKNSGRTTFRGKAGATVARTLLTFNRVASNHFVELFNHVAGLPVGALRSANLHFQDAVAESAWAKSGATPAARMAASMAKVMAELHPDDANSIMRQLKTGSIGAGMLTLGMLAPAVFGGMNYQRKRKDGDPGFAEIKIGGVTIPKVVSMAFPPLLAAQLGATITQTMDSKLRKKDKETQGVAAGIASGLAGMAESGPVVNEASRLHDLMDEHTRMKWVGGWIKGNLIPGLLDEIAQVIDRDGGVPVKRSTTGILDQIQSAIPIEREKLPKAKKH